MSSPLRGQRVLMLLDNPCSPDWRVQREASALRDGGAEVFILCWDREGNAPAREVLDGITIQRLRTPSRRGVGVRQLWPLAQFYRRAAKMARVFAPSIVHAHDFPLLPLGAYLARRTRVPLLYDAHEIYHVMEATKYPSLLRRAMATVEGFLLRNYVKTFVTVSQQRVDEYWRAVTGTVRTFVVGNWYNPDTPSAALVTAAREKLGIRSGALCVVYAGGLAPERRLDLLLLAAKRLPDIDVMIAGRGEAALENELRDTAQRLPNVTFLGWVADPSQLYEAANALYYVLDPSHPYSRFAASNTLYIALARGLPLITSATGEPGTIMRGVAPELVLSLASGDELVKALTYLAKNGSVGKTSRALAALQSKFTWDVACATLMQAYAYTLEDHAVASPV